MHRAHGTWRSSSLPLLVLAGCCIHDSIAIQKPHISEILITNAGAVKSVDTKGALELQLNNAAKEVDIYNADTENGAQSTAAWVESVLGTRRQKWELLVSARGKAAAGGTPPIHRNCIRHRRQEKKDSEPCSHRRSKCREAQQYLTTASCVPAAGYKGENHQVCHFKNLYSSGNPEVHRLVAHVVQTLNSDFPVEHVCNVRTTGEDIEPHVNIQYHSSLEAFADFVEGVPVLTKLTLAFKPHWQNNIGHALYDSLYPAFVSLLQVGRHEASYRTLLLQGPPDPEYHMQERLANEDIFAVIGGSNKNSTYELNGLYRFEEVVVGDGPNSAECDINVNFTLGGGRSLGAAGFFRDRIYRSFGLPAPPKRTVFSNQQRAGNELLQGILINNPGHMGTDHFAGDAVTSARSVGVNLTSMSWMDPVFFPAVDGLGGAPGPNRFRQHLRLLARTDIHISGPGTTMMYQQLLPDGSVVVNLGDQDYGNTMDEYMAEGASYLRAIYAVPHPGVTTTAAHVVLLAKIARDAILAGFPTSGVTGASLSPSAAVVKAYAHLEYMQSSNGSIDPYTPLRKLETFGCNPGVEDTIATAMLSIAPCKDHSLMDVHLLDALRQDFDTWHGASSGWFNSPGPKRLMRRE